MEVFYTVKQSLCCPRDTDGRRARELRRGAARAREPLSPIQDCYIHYSTDPEEEWKISFASCRSAGELVTNNQFGLVRSFLNKRSDRVVAYT